MLRKWILGVVPALACLLTAAAAMLATFVER